jgi:CheY-like chemotaxis protein
MANKIFQDPDKWSKNGSDIILRNSNQLLRLINQMLDLAKLESGKIQLNEIQADIIPYICYLVESFHSYAESKKVNLHLLPQVEYLIMDYDHKRVREIISNLLSNAIKFTPEAGNVYVSILADEKHLILKIKDTGIGIPEAKLPHIFDRFYQTDDSSTRTGEGTGIGLALTQEMTNLMGGSIFVKSDVDKGSEFTVQLPIKNMANKSDHFPTEGHRAHTYIDSAPHFETALFAPNDDQNLPLVLIVEDNVDVVTYLLSCLEGDYRTEIAFDGNEGIEKAIALGPDIIISDVMMPKKDGFEVCDVLKNDMQTNHIPIILLTAKADIDSRLVGIKTGADVYLAKPFHEEELQFQIIRLLELRSELQKKYSDPNYLTGKMKFQAKTTVSRQEDLFITKIRDFVLANLSDENLDVDRICKEIGLSRTSLHNKLKALTNKSTTEFIRFIRINKAADLLAQNRDKHVAEIANETGFVSPSYFAKVFKELFGVNPTEYKNRY